MESIVSYKNRGHYGDSSWRGNTSGHLLVDLFKTFLPNFVLDPAEGSGTTGAVCRQMGIEYVGLDLHSGFNILKQLISSVIAKAPDFIFFHPPYGDMIQYSGNVWGDKAVQDDLSRCSTPEEFLEKIELALLNIYDALQAGGKYGVLIGDQRKAGRYHSYQSDIINMGIGTLQSVIIKTQHNCESDFRQYKGKSTWIPIKHEYCIVFSKDRGVAQIGLLAIERTKKLTRSFYGTWMNVLEYSLRKLGGKATLQELYKFVGIHVSAEENKNIDAKIRQVARRHFACIEKGKYALPELAQA